MPNAGEIGDSWIHGVGSDPLRVADFRAASRARAACVADPACPSQVRLRMRSHDSEPV